MTSRQPTIKADVCILGGGPHGLAAALHLRAADPNCKVVTVEPSGTWLHTWRQQFACAEIPTLRSPVVHHPAPGATSLRDYVASQGLPTSGLPYNVPTTESFEQFCAYLTESPGGVEASPPTTDRTG